MRKDNITIEITKKDKIYLSIILVLLCAIVCLAIVLPRPYKIVEVEKPVYETVYQKVYDTEQVYIISETSSLYDSGLNGYIDANGNKFCLEHETKIIDSGSLKKIVASVLENNEKKEIIIEEAYVELLISNSQNENFGVDIKVDAFLMNAIKELFKTHLGSDKIDPLEEFLFEIEFEKAQVNMIVSFLSE